MKKIKFLHILALVLPFVLFSCSGEVEPIDPTINLNPVVPALPASFKVGFSGQTFNATHTDAMIANGLISINASVDLESFSVSVTGLTTGTYLLTNGNMISYSAGVGQPIFSSYNPEDPAASTGQITITSIDTTKKTISGTFSFTGYNKVGTITTLKEFTNGVITNIPYTN